MMMSMMDFLRYGDNAYDRLPISSPWFALNSGPTRRQPCRDGWSLRWRKYWYPDVSDDECKSGDEEECRCPDCSRSRRSERSNGRSTVEFRPTVKRKSDSGVKDQTVAIQHIQPESRKPDSSVVFGKAQTEPIVQQPEAEENCLESLDVASPAMNADSREGNTSTLPTLTPSSPIEPVGDNDDANTVTVEETKGVSEPKNTESHQHSSVTESTEQTQDDDSNVTVEEMERDTSVPQTSTETLENQDNSSNMQHEVSSPNVQDSEQMEAEEEMETDKIPSDEDSEVFGKLIQIMSIVGNVGKHNATVLAFSGSRQDKEYLMVEDSLMKALLALDSIESGSHQEVRLARKAAVKYVQQIVEKLEHGSTRRFNITDQ